MPSIDERHRAAFRRDLLEWFQLARRELPWRRSRDPYRVWISEIMLQQTRVDQAIPYFYRFLEKFPDVSTLARASIDEVLSAWEGLGYYSRAHNMHRTARIVAEERGGYFPDSITGLRDLPGIGPYTSAAIASIVFDRPHAVVDGNVIRVLSRVFRIQHESKSAAMRNVAQQYGDELISTDSPGTYNEGMMELGALVCTPRTPKCNICPLSAVCLAHEDGEPERYPRPTPKAVVPHHHISVGLITEDDRILIQRRPDEAMLGGLWEFPGGKKMDAESLTETCRREVREETGLEVAVDDKVCEIRHAYSHFRITLHAYRCRIVGGELTDDDSAPRIWARIEDLDQYAFPRANRRVLEMLKSDAGTTERESDDS